MTPEKIEFQLRLDAWQLGDRGWVTRVVEMAAQVYAGFARDQGTPYIEHPIAVCRILLDEAGVSEQGVLALALLHDALELRPEADRVIGDRLGHGVAEALRAVTPDHRLERRARGPCDDENYQRKLRTLPDQLLAIKLADRLHNLRDLPGSASPERNRRFLVQIADFYLPLAHRRGQASLPIRRLAALLQDRGTEREWPL